MFLNITYVYVNIYSSANYTSLKLSFFNLLCFLLEYSVVLVSLRLFFKKIIYLVNFGYAGSSLLCGRSLFVASWGYSVHGFLIVMASLVECRL